MQKNVSKWPYAFQRTTGKILSACHSKKSDGPFDCCSCGDEMIIHKGDILIHHFAHKSSNINFNYKHASVESFEHIYAKQLIKDHLTNWKLQKRCNTCSDIFDKIYTFTENQTCELEYKFDKYCVDAMVLNNKGNVYAPLEVRHTHAVDMAKHQFFLDSALPIFEMLASDIICAFETQKFYVTIINYDCIDCENQKKWKDMRPCIQCNEWKLISKMTKSLDETSKYKYKYTCEKCIAYCDKCHIQIIMFDKLMNNGLCNKCEYLRNMRRCIYCQLWMNNDNKMIYVDPPINYRYQKATVCLICYKSRLKYKMDTSIQK
jgi:hypothetical protein